MSTGTLKLIVWDKPENMGKSGHILSIVTQVFSDDWRTNMKQSESMADRTIIEIEAGHGVTMEVSR
jgi:hypothetical protein